MRTGRRVITISVILGLTVWVTDTVNDYLFFYEGSFLGLLISDVPPHELYIRPVILAFFVLFGVIISRVITRQKQAEEALQKTKTELEVSISERTDELRIVNDRLESELTERKVTEEALRESERQLRHLSSQLLTAQENERRRISRELHDGLGQSLALLKLRLRSIQNNLTKDQPGLREDCEQNLSYIDQVIEDVRRLSRDLTPSILEDLGLSAALRWLIDSFTRNYNIGVTLDLLDIENLFSEDARIIIYRIFQEALTNIGKHAEATHLSVAIQQQNGGVSFLLEDNGKGFNLKHAMMRDITGKGLGLATMDERVRMLGGSLLIRSQEGKGTRIGFTIPTEKRGIS